VLSPPNRIRTLASKSIKHVLHQLGFTVRHLRKFRASFIITFHLIRPEESPHFEATVLFLAQNFPIVQLDELLTLSSATMSRQGVLVLTFDDGLRSHVEVVYPVLKRLHVPATFYICSDLIGHPGSIWTWEIYSRLRRLSETARRCFLDGVEVINDPEKIVNWMKTIPVNRREQIEKKIRDRTPDFQFTSIERDSYELMDWQQLLSLDPSLITIGSHTATHIDLPQADPERLERELFRGKEILESRLDRKVKHFAYPNGNFNQQILPSVKRYYSSAVTTKWGVVKAGDDSFLLNRIHAEYGLSRLSWDLVQAAYRESRT
jgi:peptidoglycan/xylan/chitin deacetylase (PgdA/CDA1 family)